MIRVFAFLSLMFLGLAAQADKTTLTTCSRSELSGGKTYATIGVYSADDGQGHTIRSLMASSLFIDDVQMPANGVNCNRTSCGHSSGDEVVPVAVRLYPHYRHGSDVLSSITVEIRSRIMVDSFELTNCKVTDHYPNPGEEI